MDSEEPDIWGNRSGSLTKTITSYYCNNWVRRNSRKWEFPLCYILIIHPHSKMFQIKQFILTEIKPNFTKLPLNIVEILCSHIFRPQLPGFQWLSDETFSFTDVVHKVTMSLAFDLWLPKSDLFTTELNWTFVQSLKKIPPNFLRILCSQQTDNSKTWCSEQWIH